MSDSAFAGQIYVLMMVTDEYRLSLVARFLGMCVHRRNRIKSNWRHDAKEVMAGSEQRTQSLQTHAPTVLLFAAQTRAWQALKDEDSQHIMHQPYCLSQREFVQSNKQQKHHCSRLQHAVGYLPHTRVSVPLVTRYCSISTVD